MNIMMPVPSCLIWDIHCSLLALLFAVASAGSNRAANMAIIAITTNNSIKVNAREPATAPADRGGVDFIWTLKPFLMRFFSN
jgi:hypothetical protein